jgi:glucose-6-phosphate isomerase
MRIGKKPEIRYLKDLKKVLFDRNFLKKSENFPLYYIFRGLKEKGGLRYDITIIPPNILGKEFVKTKGHFHCGNFGELYKVSAGEGIFLIQKRNLRDAYFVKAKKGDFVKIPPGYGHTTINPSKKTLKIANWISKNCQSDYRSIEKMGGFCYYYTIDGWVKNKNYKRIPKLKQKKPLKEKPKSLNFLFG